MVTKQDLHLLVIGPFTPQMVLTYFHVMMGLLQFKTLVLEQLWPDSQELETISNTVVSPLMADLLQLVLGALFMSGISLAQCPTLLKPLLGIPKILHLSHFPPLPLLSQHLRTNQSSSGKLVPNQQPWMELFQGPYPLYHLQ